MGVRPTVSIQMVFLKNNKHPKKHFSKASRAPAPIKVTEFGMWMDIKALQPAKALAKIRVKETGNVTWSKEEQP